MTSITPLQLTVIYHVDKGCNRDVLVQSVLKDQDCKWDEKTILEQLSCMSLEGTISVEHDFVRVTESGWSLWSTRQDVTR